MTTKRRLSVGSNLLNQLYEDDIEEENEIDPMAEIYNVNISKGSGKRRSSVGSRRMSVFGNNLKNQLSPSKVLAEQNRIADMYKAVIQLSTENKLNEKNSWSFDLIDHMGSIIKEESKDQRGVNFQKASCTLDASVKIYSNRVDDTYNTSHRILESLSRNGIVEEEDQNEPNDGEVTQKKASRVGSKVASNRLNITSTIEKNPENLNATKLENDQVVDPIFQKMSKAFDEGGAKGMLLTNLRILPTCCGLAFTSIDITIESNSNMDSTNQKLNVKELFSRSSCNLEDMKNLPICPEMSKYRSTLGIKEVKYSFNFEISPNPLQLSVGDLSNKQSFDNLVSIPEVQYTNDDYDNDDDNGYEMDFDENDSNSSNRMNVNTRMSMALKRMSIHPSLNSISGEIKSNDNSKFQWDNVFGNSNTSIQTNTKSLLPIDVEMNPSSDYAFFNLEALSKCNAWAGAKHWKYATRHSQRVKNSSNDNVSTNEVNDNNTSSGDSMEVKTIKKKIISKKEKFSIDFSNMDSKLLDQTLFNIPKKLESNLFTLNTLEKMEESALNNEYILPIDENVTVKDLCRLFILPNMILPPSSISESIRKALSISKQMNNSHDSVNDIVWGSNTGGTTRVNTHEYYTGSNNHNDDNEGDHEDGYYDTGDVNDDDDDDEVQTSVEINGNSLHENELVESIESHENQQVTILQAKRIVEKIDINYATVSKRVNVRKLKHDIWNHLDFSLLDPSNENMNPNKAIIDPSLKMKHTGTTTTTPQSQLSFKSMLDDLSQTQSQKEATLPFYFICLLHLANEKVLKIENPPGKDMRDLIISKDN